MADQRLRPDQFTLRTAERWLDDDPWAGMMRRAHRLEPARKRLATASA